MQDEAGMLSQERHTIDNIYSVTEYILSMVTPRRGNCYPSRCYQLVFFDFTAIVNVRACGILRLRKVW